MKVVAFDIDDTLVKEREFCISGFRKIAEALRHLVSEEEVKDVMTNALANRQNHYSALEDLLKEKNLSDKVNMSEIVSLARNHLPVFSSGTIAGAQSMIKRVIASGDVPAIITDGRSGTQRNKLSALGLLTLLKEDHILISEEQGSDKRTPVMFERLMALNPEAEAFIYIGDNPEKDFFQPKRLGWHTVGIIDKDDTNIHFQHRKISREFLPDEWIELTF